MKFNCQVSLQAIGIDGKLGKTELVMEQTDNDDDLWQGTIYFMYDDEKRCEIYNRFYNFDTVEELIKHALNEHTFLTKELKNEC